MFFNLLRLQWGERSFEGVDFIFLGFVDSVFRVIESLWDSLKTISLMGLKDTIHELRGSCYKINEFYTSETTIFFDFNLNYRFGSMFELLFILMLTYYSQA